MGKKKILIIDDQEDFCKLVKMNLELISDFEVYISTNGIKGIAQTKRLIPDLILLDITMPEMNGFEVLQRLKEDQKTMAIPVVMLTAMSDKASKEKAIKNYVEAYVAKPIDTRELKAKIEEVLERVNR